MLLKNQNAKASTYYQMKRNSVGGISSGFSNNLGKNA